MSRLPRLMCLLAAVPALFAAAPQATAQTPPEQAVTEEPVTEAQVRQLRETGLIARQTRIGEGLLLMDRQLRQVQLAQQVMALLGADQPVEVAPGEFRDFSETPVGMRERIEQLQIELELLELSEQVEQARAARRAAPSPFAALLNLRPIPDAEPSAPITPATDPVAEAVPGPAAEPPPRSLAPVAFEPDISVRELRGAAGRYTALLRVNMVDLVAAPGSELAGGIKVIAVQPGQVVLRLPDGGLKSYPTPN